MTYPHGGASQIWRDSEGGAPHNPDKSQIRDWGKRVEGFDNLAALIADTSASLGDVGDIVSMAGFRYEIAAPSVSDQHFTTAGGVKLYVVPGADGYVLEQFGVDGTGSAADFAAWEVATQTAMATGVKLNGAPGATYIMDVRSNGRLEVAPGDGQSFILDLKGSTLKFPDGMSYVSGAFLHMIYVVMASFSGVSNARAKLVRIENFTVDGNLRGQTAPEFGTSLTEQWTAIKVQAFGSFGNSIDRCEVLNWRQVDPIADSVLVGPSSGDDIDPDGDGVSQRAVIGSVLIDNVHGGTRRSARALIGVGSGASDIVISNVFCDPRESGDVSNSIEAEFSSIGEQVATVNMSNVFIDKLELGGKEGKEDQFLVRGNNVETRDFALMVFGNLEMDNSKLVVGISNTWQGKRFRFGPNVVFSHLAYDKSGTQDVRTLNFELALDGYVKSQATHEIDGTLDPGASNAILAHSSTLDSEHGRRKFYLDGVQFPESAPTSIDAYAGGYWVTNGCKFYGSLEGIEAGNLQTGGLVYSGSWVSLNDDISGVTGQPMRVYGNATGTNCEVRISGGVWPNFNFGRGGSYWAEVFKQSSRNVIASAITSTRGGVVGDRVSLDDSAYTAATSGDPVSWQCVETNSGGTTANSATWLPLLEKP